MADQTIRVENIPDSGSAEAVALSIWRLLRDKSASKDDQLLFYTRCVTAVTARDAKFYNLLK